MGFVLGAEFITKHKTQELGFICSKNLNMLIGKFSEHF